MQDRFRVEKDTMGEVSVPGDRYWGAQTQRSLNNFRIGEELMPAEIIHSLVLVKKAAAFANCDLGVLPQDKKELISGACDEILSGSLEAHFPLKIWQTGSGTQSNMNVNEVIANFAEISLKGELTGEKTVVSPNDDVNKSQSTNDVFPTAMRIASYKKLTEKTIPAIQKMIDTVSAKASLFQGIVKIGRTHLMDATPLTLGQEFSAFASQLEHGLKALENSMLHLAELPIGGTAVGTGLNTPEGYDRLACHYISRFTGLPFIVAENKFEAMASHDALVEVSGALKQLAVSLMKIANDIRLLASGPRSGLGELLLPANEPGSSIMPGKVNPTQCEALSMVCCQVVGNDVAITTGAMQGHLQLNVFMPLIGTNLLKSATLLADAVISFHDNCMLGINPNLKMIKEHLNNSLMLVTALNPHIGYYNSAKIAQYAHQHNLTLKQAALELKLLSEEDFDRWVDPGKMV